LRSSSRVGHIIHDQKIPPALLARFPAPDFFKLPASPSLTLLASTPRSSSCLPLRSCVGLTVLVFAFCAWLILSRPAADIVRDVPLLLPSAACVQPIRSRFFKCSCSLLSFWATPHSLQGQLCTWRRSSRFLPNYRPLPLRNKSRFRGGTPAASGRDTTRIRGIGRRSRNWLELLTFVSRVLNRSQGRSLSNLNYKVRTSLARTLSNRG
jgi:hypothetical protein